MNTVDPDDCRCQHWSTWQANWQPRRGYHHPDCAETHDRTSCDCLSCRTKRREWGHRPSYVVDQGATLGCGHGRPHWQMCPWCNGINNSVSAGPSVGTYIPTTITVTVEDSE